MKKLFTNKLLIPILLFAVLPLFVRSQVMEVRKPVSSDVSVPLRDMKPYKKPIWKRFLRENEDKEVPNRFRSIPQNLNAPPDPALQTVYPIQTDQPSVVNPILNFNGTGNNSNPGRMTPPDPNGDVGPNHYVQVVNCQLQMFNKSGTSVFGPVATSTIWSGFTGNWTGHNDGDAIILYDEAADRWLISQFAINCTGTPKTEYILVAISTSPDPTGSYYRYAYQFDYMPDYPKFGIWQDGYYMAINRFNTNVSGSPFVGAAASVMQRSKMLTGDPSASMIYFKTEYIAGTGPANGYDCGSMLPSDCDGPWAPDGTPNYFTYIYDNSMGGPSELRIWAFSTDWSVPSNSTFTYVTNLPVANYTMLGTGIGVIPQQGTTNKLDGLGDRLMFRNQYRNFGSYASFVTSHNVNVGSGIAGVRWYEYRKTGSTFSVYQQSTYNPGDGKSRWMGSLAMNSNGDIGMAYTVSGSTMYPSIYFTGRLSSDALNQMTVPEGIIQTGTVSMTGATRWGDYSTMNIDPSDNTTFWTTNEYIGTFGGTWPWTTKIASFRFSNQPGVMTQNASSVSLTTATLNGFVNPSGLATTYYFQYGPTTAYGTNTSSSAAGSGTVNVAETSPLAGLTTGIVYHCRIVATNTDGTSYGNDITFVPGGAILSTVAPSAATAITAASGGNITSDGGGAITARGVCWGTSANPAISGSHTTDGAGTGIFTSSLTGLSANTLYHVRAYATNSAGTWYGNDLTFMTLCNPSSLPFIENFSGTTLPSCWSQVDNSGTLQLWEFGVITGQTPNPALTGNYAYLNSDGYGTGGTQNANLISPTLDLTNFNNVTLSFNHYFRSFTGSSGTVSYSINNGTTWTTIQQFTATSATNPETFSQVISALTAQSQVKIKWNYTGTDAWYWGIDNIQLTGSFISTLAVTPSNQNVAATAGNTSFAVTSNTSWTAASSQTWCTVTPSGTGNGNITANFTANVLTSPRTANVTVTVTGLPPVVVTVTQAAAAPTLAVSPANQNVPSTAGATSFNVTSNTGWTAVSNQTWCTVTPSGTGNATITANFTTNLITSPRTANITVTVTTLAPVTVTVTQAAAAPTLVVNPANQNVTSSAGLTSFSVTSNSAWTSVSNQTWCTVTPAGSGNGTIDANYSTNPLTTPRVANVTVSVTGLPPAIVTVSQAGAPPALAVTPSSQSVPCIGGQTAFNVTSNTTWTAVSNQTWCTVTPSGTGDGVINATYLDNLVTTPRTAIITVTVTGLTPITVTVVQDAMGAYVSVIPANQNVSSSPPGSAVFNVSSNTTWTAVSGETWCTVTPSGSGNGSIDAAYQENLTVGQRIAHITVTVTGASPQIVTLTQEGAAPVLSVSPVNFDVNYESGSVNYDITSNTTWNATSDAPWCIVTSSGSGTGTMVADYTSNPLSVDRTSNITVSVIGLAPQIVSLHQDHLVSVETHNAPALKIIPNPASGKFRIESTAVIKGIKVTILDMTGRIIITRTCSAEHEMDFDLTGVLPGCYVVKATFETGTGAYRLIVAR